MSTSDRKVSIYLKKFLPQQQMVTNFLEYLLKQTRDVFGDMFPKDGVFYGGSLSGDGSDKFKIGTPFLGTDGIGRRLALDPTEASVQFENTLSATYHVGLRYNEIPRDTEVNVRTGQIEYTYIEERLGELGLPDAVVDNGATITFTIDGVAEAGVTHAGRKARVWLKRAVGQADAFYEGTVIYSGGANKLQTTNLLGQTAGLVSEDAADYYVFLVGPTVRKNTDLSLVANVCYIGTVEGAGSGNAPTVFSTAGQTRLVPPGDLTAMKDEMKSFLVGGGLITWDLTSEVLTWAQDLVVMLPNKSYQHTISAGNVTIADNEVGYLTLNDVGGVQALTVVAMGSMPDVTASYPVVMRVGNNIYFRDGALELKGDAAGDTGGRINDVTQDLLDFMGATDESDSDPNYPSTSLPDTVVTQGTSLTTAISDLNNEVVAIITNNPGEYRLTVPFGGQQVFTVPFLVDTDNTVLDVEAFIDGRRMLLDTAGGATDDFVKISTTQIQFKQVVEAGRKVVIWKQGTSYGGPAAPSSGNLWSDQMDASQIPTADIAHDVGSTTRRIREVHAQKTKVDTYITRADAVGDIKQVKVMESGHPSTMVAGTPVAKAADGLLYAADSDGASGKKYIGILLETIDFGESGRVMLTGQNLPGVLTSLGFAPGDDIFIGETAGTYTNNPGAFSGLNDDWVRIGIADCAEGAVSALATDLIMFSDVVARA